MQRRIIEDKHDWTIEERIAPKGESSRAYYYKDQLALRIELDTPIVRRLAGLTLIEKDLRTIGSWVGVLRETLVALGADPERTVPGLMPDDGRVTVARALYVAIVTTYGKMFTGAEGRGTSLHRNGWVPQRHLATHDDLMHVRHTFTAHSGNDSPEDCGVVLAVDYSRRNRTPPRLFTELHQPTTMGLPELRDVEDLLHDLRTKVDAALEKATVASYEEAAAAFPQQRLHALRKGASGKFLDRKGSGA